MENKHFYFAYGMNTDPGAMYERTGDSQSIGRARLPGWRFRFAYYADVVPDPKSVTDGVLWLMSDQGLADLDIREGYPSYYDRQQLEVECQGRVYQAWVYYMRPGEPDAMPSSSYLGMLHRGYSAFRVPKRQIWQSLRKVRRIKDGQQARAERHARAQIRQQQDLQPDLGYLSYTEDQWRDIFRQS